MENEMYPDLEQTKEWLFKCREQGHLNEWDVANAIDAAQDFNQLKDLLRFLLIEGMIKVWEPEEE